MSDIELVSATKSFGGWLKRYKHRSQVLNCERSFAIYLPAAADENDVPLLWWLSCLTCTDENFMQKAGAKRTAAELGLAMVCPDTSPRGTGRAPRALHGGRARAVDEQLCAVNLRGWQGACIVRAWLEMAGCCWLSTACRLNGSASSIGQPPSALGGIRGHIRCPSAAMNDEPHLGTCTHASRAPWSCGSHSPPRDELAACRHRHRGGLRAAALGSCCTSGDPCGRPTAARSRASAERVAAVWRGYRKWVNMRASTRRVICTISAVRAVGGGGVISADAACALTCGSATCGKRAGTDAQGARAALA